MAALTSVYLNHPNLPPRDEPEGAEGLRLKAAEDPLGIGDSQLVLGQIFDNGGIEPIDVLDSGDSHIFQPRK